MGIRFLGHIIDSNRWANAVHLSRYQGRRVAIDTNLFLYKLYYQYGNIIDGLFLFINKLVKHRITPIFVFDGRPPAEKQDVIQKRRRRRDVYREKYDELVEYMKALDEASIEFEVCHNKKVSLERKMFVASREVIEQAQEFIGLLGFNWIRHECEGEHMCAYLSAENLVDAVITDDMDALACGARVVLRGFNTRNDTIEEIRLIDCLRGLNMTLDKFRELCVITGTEYGPYDDPVIDKTIIEDVIPCIRDRGIMAIEDFTDVGEYIKNHPEFYERCQTIMAIFSLHGIELNYIQRQELYRTNVRNMEAIMNYMRQYSSLPIDTVLTRVGYLRCEN